MNPSFLKTLIFSLSLLFSAFPEHQHFVGAQDPAAGRVPIHDPPSSDPAEFTVFIINTVPTDKDKLWVHCASKDDDLGYRTVDQNKYFLWSFGENVLHTTLFFCHFWWGQRDKSFDVFKHSIGARWCQTKSCFWVVQEDGFYITDDYVKGSPLHKWETWWYTCIY